MFQSSCWATRLAPMKDMRFICCSSRVVSVGGWSAQVGTSWRVCRSAGGGRLGEGLQLGGAVDRAVRQQQDLPAGSRVLEVHGGGDVLEGDHMSDHHVQPVSYTHLR